MTLRKTLRTWLKTSNVAVVNRPAASSPLFEEIGDLALVYRKYEDYSDYVATQESLNLEKIDRVWADEPTLRSICTHLQELAVFKTGRGLCHGTRNGFEQALFGSALSMDVIGTEIAENATSFPNTVRWDFHDANPDWVAAYDFVYSNSLDHAFDPLKALEVWIDQTHSEGVVVIEWTEAHGLDYLTAGDPFGAHPAVIPYIVSRHFGGRVSVETKVSSKTNSFGAWTAWLFFLRKVPNR